MIQLVKWNTIALAIVASFLIGIYIFYLSFIYQDNTTGRFSPQENPYHSKMRFKDEQQKQIYKNQWFPTQSEQLLLQVVDGFYFPWVVNKEKQEELKRTKETIDYGTYYTDVAFKEPIQRLIKEPNNTILMEAKADGPTLSAIRIKSLLRGNLPLHVEVINNLRGVLLPDDNIVYQSKVNGQGKKVHFFGYMYWDQFVGQHFDKKVITYETSIDQATKDDQKIFDNIMEEQANNDWGTIISHYEAIDMSVHGTTSVGERNYPTLNFHDKLLKNLTDSTKNEKLQAQTIIYLTDHGQNEKHFALHGGYTDLEKQIILLGYDRRGFIQKKDRDIGQIMDRKYLLSPVVNQIDVSATYCMLRGIPLPTVNLGVIIPDFFINRPEIDNTVIINNYFVNIQQIFSYIKIMKYEKQRTIYSFGNIQQNFDKIIEFYNQLFDKYEQNGEIPNKDVKEYVGLCINLARQVKQAFEDEISGPNILNTKLTVIYFFITALISVTLIQIFSSIQYKLQEDHIDHSQIQSAKTENKKIYYKLGIISFIAYAGFISMFLSTFQTFLLFYAFGILILLYFLRTQCQNLNLKNLIIPYKVSNSNFYGLIDTFLILSGIIFNSVLRLTNDFFERTYDLTQVFVLLFYVIWLLLTLFSKKISLFQKIYLSALMLVMPILTYQCGYHSKFQSKEHNQFFIVEDYVKYFSSFEVKFYYPMAFLGFIYAILIYKSCKAIQGSWRIANRLFFGLLCCSQIICLFKFLIIQTQYVQNYGREEYEIDTNYYFIAQVLFLSTEVYKIIFINRNKVNPPNFSWKYATFLMNFYLQALYVLHYESIIKYSVLLLMVYLVGHFHNKLQIMECGSKYLYLYLLTSWFFYVTDHMERLTNLHVEVLKAGALFSGVFYPVLNGTLNTFFGQFSIALIIPLFVVCEKYQLNNLNVSNSDDKQCSFLDIIFSNSSEVDIFSQDNKQVEKRKEYFENMNIRAYLYFIIPIFFSFAIAILRNSMKPFDYFMNKYYIPSFFFQVMFLGVILISFFISFMLIKLQNHKVQVKQNYYDELVSEKFDHEVELEKKDYDSI